LWFLDQLDPGSPAYNVPTAIRIDGMLEIDALARSVSEVIHRHEALRTTFAQDEEGRAVSIVQAEPLAGLLVEDLRGVPDASAVAQAEAEREARTPFALEHGPLLRVRLLILSEREHLLLFTMHHIVSDGWSIGVLIHEVTTLYEAFASGRPSPLPPLAIQYADYAVWQREWLSGVELEQQTAHWKAHLAGAPVTLDLPTDRPRPAVQTVKGQAFRRELGRELSSQVDALSQKLGATPFMTLFAAFNVLRLQSVRFPSCATQRSRASAAGSRDDGGSLCSRDAAASAPGALPAWWLVDGRCCRVRDGLST
jgi:hypothetical protein